MKLIYTKWVIMQNNYIISIPFHIRADKPMSTPHIPKRIRLHPKREYVPKMEIWHFHLPSCRSYFRFRSSLARPCFIGCSYVQMVFFRGLSPFLRMSRSWPNNPPYLFHVRPRTCLRVRSLEDSSLSSSLCWTWSRSWVCALSPPWSCGLS